MMKMAMRFDKSQVKPIQKWTTPGYFTFPRALAIMAGYTTFEVLVVGAAGGASGLAITDTNNENDRGYWYPHGGGGGGGIHVKGSLLNDFGTLALTTDVGVIVGSPGTTGADSSANTRAGSGTDGELSSFFGYIGPGGEGAQGGKFDAIIRNQPNVNTDKVEIDVPVAVGGDGGYEDGFSAYRGQGGTVEIRQQMENTGGYVYWGEEPGSDGQTAPGEGIILNRFTGGGGGGGRYNVPGFNRACQSGRQAVGPGGFIAPGEARVSPYNNGGRGGGMNFRLLTGVDEYAGGGLFPNGGVVLKLS